MTTIGFIIVAVMVLAYANGANDNYKGVATLFGTGTTSYRLGLWWATVATLLGSITAVILAGSLLHHFTGKGLVPHELAGEAGYVTAVALGAGITVLVATRFGLPISTTHGLIGGLIGAGLAAGASIDGRQLVAVFLLPLIASPLLAIASTAMLYVVARRIGRWSNISAETCICVGRDVVEVVPAAQAAVALERVRQLPVAVGNRVTCRRRYRGRVLGLDASFLFDALHFLSAGLVSFGRGLNDTPKIAALLLVAPRIGGATATITVGVLIAVGGIISARRVAETMGHKITPMSHGQGLTANMVTGLIVLGASPLGFPVSTTHVSCGSLFGLGGVTGRADRKMIAAIVASWLFTLPLAALLAAGSWCLVH